MRQVAFLLAGVCAASVVMSAQPTAITIVLTGQSMIRSDLRATKPAAVPAIKGLLDGDVIFTNLEAAVALPGQTIQEGRAFLTPPEALDALTAMGFDLLALSGNHAFDLKERRSPAIVSFKRPGLSDLDWMPQALMIPRRSPAWP